MGVPLPEIRDYGKQHAGEGRQSEPEKLHELILTLCRRADQAIAEILTPAQRCRLRQIAIQQMGLRAFNRPAVIEALGLTAAQRQSLIRRFDLVYNDPEELRKLFSPEASLNQAARTLVELHRHRMERAVESLTAEQQARWKELTGEPIEGDLLFFLMGRSVSIR